jgi:[ribosomal protein S5]-alanine N-acetyltransferase
MVIGMRLAPPEPPLADELVALRPWRADDAPNLAAALDGDPEITRWLDQIPQPYGLGEAHGYLEACRRGWETGAGASFAILGQIDGTLVGSLGMRLADLPGGVAEAGYWVAREARGRGVATHALRLASRWLFRAAEVERLQLRADALNVPSQRVAENAGFTREGVLRSLHYNPRLGRRVDFVMFSLLPGELP